MYVFENLDGETVEFEALEDANAAAGADCLANTREVIVRYRTADGNEIVVGTHTVNGQGGENFHPWERVQQPKFQSPHFPGYTLAYIRTRISASVYRANDKTHWLIHDGRTQGTATRPNTKTACHLTSAMKTTPLPGPAEAEVAA